MTDLERIEIEGFKGLESISFEPSNFNLITGRNNTGKTSLLEAIDLLFNPSNIGRYGDDLDRVINKGYTQWHVEGTTSVNETKVHFKQPGIESVGKYFIQTVGNTIARRTRFVVFSDNVEWDIQKVLSQVESVAQNVLAEEVNENDLTDLREEFFEVVVNGTTYPFHIAGKKSEEIIELVYQRIPNELEEHEANVLSELLGVHQTSLDNWEEYESAVSNISYRARAKFGRGNIQGFLTKPENTDAVKFIESASLADDIESEDEETDAVKIDDIGDFIKERGIVDDLKTFDIDYLIFDEDGEKYQIPYNFMGDGFKAVVGLLWELLDDNNENDIVLLEEPENHMHPGYIREVVYFLIELARDEDVQLFITTHNSDFINSFFTENLTDDEEEYLEEEFSLIRMEEDTAVVQDYETAKDDLKNLHLDLRGI